MLTFLKNHPFAVEAFFESSLVLTYALPVDVLRPLVPPQLEPDTFMDQAFLAVAIVQTRNLRPKGFPAFMGNDFVLTGYRIFVRYTNSDGRRLRGLYILRSETDKKKMAVLGNIFTHYNYQTTDIRVTEDGNTLQVLSKQSDLDISVNMASPDAALPAGSPFASWKEARRFAGPLPFTFTCDPGSRKVLIIEGVRENWTPHPVEVIGSKAGFLNRPEWKQAKLANAFIIRNIPYYWKKGKVDIWKQ